MRLSRVAFVGLLVLTGAVASLAQEGAPPPPAPDAAAPPAAPSPAAAAPAPLAPASSSSAAPAAPAQTADVEYDLKMKELEGMVSELKEQIFRSKAKLQLLAEQVAGGIGTGAKIVIVHKNTLGGSFLVTEASYYLDGQPLWQEVDEGGLKLTEKRDLPVWDGNIVEGSHTLTVRLVVRGNGTGVFQYLSGFKWTLKDSITFTAEPGKVFSLDVVAFEKGNFTTPMEERPNIRFDSNISRDSRVDEAKKKDEAAQ